MQKGPLSNKKKKRNSSRFKSSWGLKKFWRRYFQRKSATVNASKTFSVSLFLVLSLSDSLLSYFNLLFLSLSFSLSLTDWRTINNPDSIKTSCGKYGFFSESWGLLSLSFMMQSNSEYVVGERKKTRFFLTPNVSHFLLGVAQLMRCRQSGQKIVMNGSKKRGIEYALTRWR